MKSRTLGGIRGSLWFSPKVDQLSAALHQIVNLMSFYSSLMQCIAKSNKRSRVLSQKAAKVWSVQCEKKRPILSHMIAVQFSYCNGTHAMAKGNIWKYNVCRAPDTRKWWLHEMSGACLAWHGAGVSFLWHRFSLLCCVFPWHQAAYSPTPPLGDDSLEVEKEKNRETLTAGFGLCH